MSKDVRQEGKQRVSGSLGRSCRYGTERCKKEVKMSDRYYWILEKGNCRLESNEDG